jgi:hypothetical protein
MFMMAISFLERSVLFRTDCYQSESYIESNRKPPMKQTIAERHRDNQRLYQMSAGQEMQEKSKRHSMIQTASVLPILMCFKISVRSHFEAESFA